MNLRRGIRTRIFKKGWSRYRSRTAERKRQREAFTSSEHNRLSAENFLDTEKPLDTSTVQNPSDSQEILKPTENNTEQQEDLENINLDSQPDIPIFPRRQTEPPKSGVFSNAVTRRQEINGISANLIKRNLMLILLNIPQIVRRKKRSRIVRSLKR